MKTTIPDPNSQPWHGKGTAAGTPAGGHPARRWLTKVGGMNIVIAAFCLMFIGAIWTTVVFRIRTERVETIANAFRQNSNLARVFEEQTIRTVKGVDAAALLIGREYARLGPKIDLARYIKDGLIDGKLFNILSVVDESGAIVSSSGTAGADNYAERDYFRFHLRHDTDEFFIGKPVLDRISGAWQIPMTRRIIKQDGSFGGVVVLSVNPAYFTNFYREADLGENGLVMLTGLDGVSRARYSSGKTSTGMDLSNSPLFKEELKHGVGSFSTTGKVENVPRFVSYRTLPDYPLIVAVGTSQEEVLAGFRRERNYEYRAALLFSVVIVSFAALLIAGVARQKRTVAALIDSETRFRATFDHAAVGIAHTSIDRRFLRVNQNLCAMLGYTREELTALRPRDITHPEDRKGYDDNQARLVSGELNTFSSEARYIRKDGSMIWVNRTVSLVRDSAGQPLYFIRVIEDISERRRMREALEASEAHTRVIFERAAVGISVTALDGTVRQANPKLCDITGYSRQELLARTFMDITHPEDAPKSAARRKQMLAGEIISPVLEKRYFHKNGAVVWVAIATSLVRDANGEPDYFVNMVEDITERKELQQNLQHLAHHDSLTGLPNRELFYDRLEHALDQARRRKWTIGVMFIDLDRFKMVNDTLGHGVGDQLLQQVAARLAHCVRADDTVGRLGGDEFAVILSELAHDEDGSRVARKIIDALGAPFQIDGNEIVVTPSIGITSCPPDGADADSLVRNADSAMYDAKKAGKNNYQFYTAATNERAQKKLALERDLRQALIRNEFVLHFQPKAHLVTGGITGMEALLRWQRPGGALLPPAEFIPLLEETGLIVPAGEWVLRAACAQISAWRKAGLTPVPIAVNLSANQFHQQDICEMVLRALREYDVDPQFLQLEVTESAAMLNAEQTAATLRNLRALDVHIAIDDFGTGYSSLAYLKRFPIDSLKIDRSFVADLPGNADDASIAQAVITMAHALRLKVVAEGVENEAQLEFLAASGCDEMQGYFFSRPLPADECTQLLREARKLPLRQTSSGRPLMTRGKT